MNTKKRKKNGKNSKILGEKQIRINEKFNLKVFFIERTEKIRIISDATNIIFLPKYQIFGFPNISFRTKTKYQIFNAKTKQISNIRLSKKFP
jgi:hypothetical protein